MRETQQKRLQRRLLTHHLPLFVVSTLSAAALYFTNPSQDVISRASFATAYPALALLVLTLLVGPWRVLGKRRNPASNDLRRDFGIWAGMVGILHSVIGQMVHLRGKPWLYYVYGPKERHVFPVRHDLFGLANYTGLIGALLLIALLAASNDLSLRAFGAEVWKQLQRWNYAVFGLVAVHSIAYLEIEKQRLPFVAVVVVCILTTLCLHIAGFVRRRSESAIRP